MELPTAGQYLLIALTPTLIAVTMMCAPRWLGALLRAWPDSSAHRGPQPLGPPIERLAADLRRLIRLHGTLEDSAHLAVRAHRIWAVEAAISARAIEAARALEVPYVDSSAQGRLDVAELRGLLRALGDAGLVLPAAVRGFTDDGRL